MGRNDVAAVLERPRCNEDYGMSWVRCKECNGLGTKRYAMWAEMPFSPTNTATDLVMKSVEDKCRACNGVGHPNRIPVVQPLSAGAWMRIGSVPYEFDPERIRSRCMLYQPRHGDFVRGDGVWIADGGLGNGDLEAVPGFVWDRE